MGNAAARREGEEWPGSQHTGLSVAHSTSPIITARVIYFTGMIDDISFLVHGWSYTPRVVRTGGLMSSICWFVRWTLVIAVVVACALLAPAVGVTSVGSVEPPPALISGPAFSVNVVAVANFVELRVPEATQALNTAGLVPGQVSGADDRVRGQRLVAGSQIASGTAVNATLGDPGCSGYSGDPGCSGQSKPPKYQKHPGPKGCWGHSRHSGCSGSGRSECWGSGRHPGCGRRQELYIPRLPPIRPIQPICAATVPNLVNRTERQARSALTAVGLVLWNDPEGNRSVTSQVPLAGTRVLCGWAVTVTVYVPPPAPVVPPPAPVVPPAAPVVPPPAPVVPPPAPESALIEPIPWLWPVAIAVILLSAGLLVGLLILLAFRARKGQKWVRAHVRAVVGAAPGVGVEVMESRTDYSPPSCVVRLEPHADSGMQVLEEAHR